mgnify:CR=1 FL=1
MAINFWAFYLGSLLSILGFSYEQIGEIIAKIIIFFQ